MLSWRGFKYVAKAPKVIYSYVHLIVIIILVLFLSQHFVNWVAILQRDFNGAYESEKLKHDAKRDECRFEYYRNKCSPEERREALEKNCRNWESCMNEGPDTAIKNIDVFFGLIVQALNTIFGKMEQKTLIFFGLILFLGAWILSKYVSSASLPVQRLEISILE